MHSEGCSAPAPARGPEEPRAEDDCDRDIIAVDAAHRDIHQIWTVAERRALVAVALDGQASGRHAGGVHRSEHRVQRAPPVVRPDMTQAPIVLLVNPAAGRGRASRVAQAAQQALRDAGLSVVVHEARGRGDEARIAEAASIANAQALAVVGGDGAVSHAVRGLLDGEARGGARVPLAIFAAGTGNDFAKSLAVPVHHVQRMAAHVA